jgi:ribosomal protein S27AE
MTLEKCPRCRASWQGAAIPEDRRASYGNATHFNRGIAIYDFNDDMTIGWRCPDCGAGIFPQRESQGSGA